MNTTSRYHYRPARQNPNPSFSSSLLDEIYRSIDERDDQELMVYREKHSSFSINGYFQNDHQSQQKVSEKVVVRRKSGEDFKRRYHQNEPRYFNSSSSSSDSSCAGGFSSSEAESVYGVSSKPKPIRTSTNQFTTREKQRSTYGQNFQFEDYESKPKHEGKFVRTKSRAMKIYGDLKKVKQPISPGGRLATFLNSLFTNAKNTKLSSSADAGDYIDRSSKSANASTCSSASSFSRSCLSNTPSSRGKLSNNKKRSVRFYPVSVIVDEDCQPCGHKSVYGEESNLPTIKFVNNAIKSEKNRRIEEAARDLLRNYQKKVECEFDLIKSNVEGSNDDINMNYEDDEDDDDDAASHTSSDLFELENFSAIGMEKYRDELPVYETTHLDMNLAMGDGLLV